MTCVRASLVTLMTVVGSLLWLMPATLRAQPARGALVIGNGTYTTLPPLPGCLQSAHAVAAALRGAGFNVVEREDVSSGAAGAAIGEFSALMAANPGAAAVVYTCGYATTFNDRPFLLPVSANITRPADVLTQGLLAKSLIDVLVRGEAGPAIIAMDVVPLPDPAAPLHLDALGQLSLPDGLGLVAVTQVKPPDTPTPLAAALMAELKATMLRTTSVLSGIEQRIGAGRAATLAVLRMPASPGYLAGAALQSGPAAAPAPSQAASPLAAAEAATIPTDDLMTGEDRRRIQTALVRLGYYDGKVDGIFGPDSRAAIRRYQHELGADMTGRLTAGQANRLVSGR